MLMKTKEHKLFAFDEVSNFMQTFTRPEKALCGSSYISFPSQLHFISLLALSISSQHRIQKYSPTFTRSHTQ